MTYRTKDFNPDYRRGISKTMRYCEVCQRDLKIGQPVRRIMWELDTLDAVHSEDWEIAEVEIKANRSHPKPVQTGLVGMSCAKTLGLEWTRPEEALP
jgi:hypothetical protein